ncbi:MAG: nucleoside-diphosphate kinase [candidate division NC10 bacterium]|nr:nucleoside-diphosphate kinase [candidate division NC10 bacterium]
MERTLVLIKPDAVGQSRIGRIISRFEEKGLRVAAMKMVWLTREEGARFYSVHKEKPFYGSLTDFISSGPLVAMVLEGEEAIFGVREIMGATDPGRAAEGTIRREMGSDVERNAVHGSDSPSSAAFEIPFFFPEMEIFPPGKR